MVPLLALSGLINTSGLYVSNLPSGAILRYPVVIIRGVAPDGMVNIRNVTSGDKATQTRSVATRFSGAVQLEPGQNTVIINQGKTRARISLKYVPIQSPYVVKATFVLASDDPDGYIDGKGQIALDYRKRMSTALKLMQSATAEMMNDAGFGRKTFNLELDSEGEVKVYSRRLPFSGEELRSKSGEELWSKIHAWLQPETSGQTVRHCVVMGFTRYDAVTKQIRGSTALGGDYLGLFSSGSMFSWPKSISESSYVFSDFTKLPATAFDDSSRKKIFGAASTTIGATLHELGHTFGLPHSNDPQCIMTRGFDLFNRLFTSYEPTEGGMRPIRPDERPRWSTHWANWLNWSPWFQAEANGGTAFDFLNPPQFSFDDRYLRVQSPHGLSMIGAWCKDGKPSFFKTLDASANKTFTLNLDEIANSINASGEDFYVYATDSQCNTVSIKLPQKILQEVKERRALQRPEPRPLLPAWFTGKVIHQICTHCRPR